MCHKVWPTALERPSQYLKQRLETHLVSIGNGLCMSSGEPWTEAVGLAVPQRMGNDLDDITASSRLEACNRLTFLLRAPGAPGAIGGGTAYGTRNVLM